MKNSQHKVDNLEQNITKAEDTISSQQVEIDEFKATVREMEKNINKLSR